MNIPCGDEFFRVNMCSLSIIHELVFGGKASLLHREDIHLLNYVWYFHQCDIFLPYAGSLLEQDIFTKATRQSLIQN